MNLPYCFSPCYLSSLDLLTCSTTHFSSIFDKLSSLINGDHQREDSESLFFLCFLCFDFFIFFECFFLSFFFSDLLSLLELRCLCFLLFFFLWCSDELLLSCVFSSYAIFYLCFGCNLSHNAPTFHKQNMINYYISAVFILPFSFLSYLEVPLSFCW